LDPTAAEATALFHGVNFCKDLGITNLLIEGDSQVIISATQKQDVSNCRFGHLVDDIGAVMSSFPRWQIRHVGRDFNRAAHGLAKVALKNVMDRKWDHSIPN
jgi:ribonuclease HI